VSDTAPVRPGEHLDWPRIESWLRARLPACDIAGLDLSQPMAVRQFPGGHSNLTYLVAFGSTELVVRRPPIGPVAPTAHDMAREFRWLRAVHPVFPLAPRAYILCEDTDVAGCVFYVMERRRGTVVRHEEPAGLADHPERRGRLSDAMLTTLARLHVIDVSTPPLSTLGKPQGFVERQVRGWSERWQRSRTTELADMDRLATWLGANLPPNPEHPSIVHGDFKLDNLILDTTDLTRIVGVMDWEMSALGDPLVDVGILLAYWVPTSPAGHHDSLSPVTDRPGWYRREEIVARYAELSGRDVSGIRFYEVFALFKIAVVIQQIYQRFVVGQTTDRRFARFGERVAFLAGGAVSRLES